MNHTPFVISLAFSLASTVAFLSITLALGFGSRRSTAGKANPDREDMRRHALWGILYMNPADPRGWVPKLYGYGYTVNFRRKTFALMFLTSLLLILASTVCLLVFIPR